MNVLTLDQRANAEALDHSVELTNSSSSHPSYFSGTGCIRRLRTSRLAVGDAEDAVSDEDDSEEVKTGGLTAVRVGRRLQLLSTKVRDGTNIVPTYSARG
jgi:hypothetical protein